MTQPSKRMRPAPLNIQSFKTKLATQHHKIDNITQTNQKKKDHSKVQKKLLNVSQNQSQPYMSPRFSENSHENSIVMINSSDVHKLNSLSSLRKQQSNSFKIKKVQCSQNKEEIENEKIKQKNGKKSSERNSLAGISQIKPIKQISFRQKNQHQDSIFQRQQKKSESRQVRNPESNSNIKHGYKLMKQRGEESFQIVQVAQQQSLFKNKQDKVLTNEISEDQKFLSPDKHDYNFPNFTTLKKQPNRSYQSSNLSKTNSNRFHKTEYYIVSPLKKKSPKFQNSQKSQKFIELKQNKLKNSKSGKFGRFEDETDRVNDNEMFTANLFNHVNDQEQQKLKLLMKNQKKLKLKDYLRLSSLSNDTKYDRYHNSLAKNNISGNQNHFNMRNSDTKQQNEIRKSVIDPKKSIVLIKVSLKKKLQKLIQLAFKVFQQVSEDKGLVQNQYEDLVFLCNFHRILDDNLFKSVSLLQELMGSFIGKRQFQNKYVQWPMRQLMEKMSPRKRKKSKQKQEQVDIDGLIQKMLQIFINKPKQKPVKNEKK